MATQFIDGFDKYGPVGMGGGQSSLSALLTASEWTSVSVSTAPVPLQIVAPLSLNGGALKLVGKTLQSETALNKSIGSNLGRIIGGLRFAVVVGTGTPDYCITFNDTGVGSGAGQCAIVINGQSGTFAFWTGSYWIHASSSQGGSAITTSPKAVSSGATHYLEWDITIGTSSPYEIWLDGVPLMLGTGNTRGATTNNTINGISLVATQINGTASNLNGFTVDDLYLFDTTTSINNAVLQTSPRIETTFPSADSLVQFGPAAVVIGADYSLVLTTNAPGANFLFLQKVTPAVNMTINSVGILPMATSGGAKFKAVLYSDSTGNPGSLITSGTEVVGSTSGTALIGALSSAEALTGGTSYWIGFITDTSVVLAEVDGTTVGGFATGQAKANTYSGGAPAGPLSGMTVGLAGYMMWGNCTSAVSNFVAENLNPPLGDSSYVTDSTIGHEDLFTFPNLSITPTTVYTVGMKAYMRLSSSGSRTVDLDMKSSGTDGNGSQTAIIPTTSYAWAFSYFDTDPHTSAQWSGSAVNAATAGYKIAS